MQEGQEGWMGQSWERDRECLMSLEEVSAGRGPGLILHPSVYAVANGFTNVVSMKQAMCRLLL